MSLDVIVVMDNSELGEEILKTAWLAAQAIFKNYGIEVYVIPYYNPKATKTVVIVNDVEYVVDRKLSVNEFIDMILSSPMTKNAKNKEFIVMGMAFDDGDLLGSAVVA